MVEDLVLLSCAARSERIRSKGYYRVGGFSYRSLLFFECLFECRLKLIAVKDCGTLRIFASS